MWSSKKDLEKELSVAETQHAKDKLLLVEKNIAAGGAATEEQKKQFIVRDNVSTGEWDFDLLANEWSIQDLDNWGLDIPAFGNDIESKDNAVGGTTCPNCGVTL